MAEFERDWARETQKVENEADFVKNNSKKGAQNSKVIVPRDQRVRDNGDIAGKLENIQISDDFKWQETNGTFSFNFSVDK